MESAPSAAAGSQSRDILARASCVARGEELLCDLYVCSVCGVAWRDATSRPTASEAQAAELVIAKMRTAELIPPILTQTRRPTLQWSPAPWRSTSAASVRQRPGIRRPYREIHCCHIPSVICTPSPFPRPSRPSSSSTTTPSTASWVALRYRRRPLNRHEKTCTIETWCGRQHGRTHAVGQWQDLPAS